MRIFDTGLALVVAHLSSGEADGDELRRNYDYSEITRRAAFLPDTAPAVDPEAVDARQPQEGVSKVGLLQGFGAGLVTGHNSRPPVAARRPQGALFS